MQKLPKNNWYNEQDKPESELSKKLGYAFEVEQESGELAAARYLGRECSMLELAKLAELYPRLGKPAQDMQKIRAKSGKKITIIG